MSQPLWKDMEAWLLEHEHEDEDFNAQELAASAGVRVWTATQMIQAYLVAVRRKNSPALFVLKREGQTRAARWSVGDRQADFKAIEHQLYRDVVTKIKRGFEPDLRHLGKINPKLRRQAELTIEALTGGVLVMLRTTLGGLAPEDEGDDEE